MGGAISVAVTVVGAGLGARVGTAAVRTSSDGWDPNEEDSIDEDVGQDEASEDTNSEGLVDEGMHNRRPECKRCRRERYCRYAQA